MRVCPPAPPSRLTAGARVTLGWSRNYFERQRCVQRVPRHSLPFVRCMRCRRHAPDRAASAAQPERVFAEVFRVLKPGGCCIMTFSNRLYYEKVRAVPSQAQWSPGLHCETVLAAPDQASMLSCLAL